MTPVQWCDTHDSPQADIWPVGSWPTGKEGKAYCYRWSLLFNESTSLEPLPIDCVMTHKMVLTDQEVEALEVLAWERGRNSQPFLSRIEPADPVEAWRRTRGGMW